MHKPSKLLSLVWEFTKRSGKSLWREARLSWQFIGRDYSTTLLPALLFLIAAWNSQSSSWVELLWALGRGLVYIWLYIFPFCLANQIVGVEEDALNKPERPLVTGAVCYRGAQIRFAVSMVLFSLVGLAFGVLPWALLWQACIILYNFGGVSKHWIGKSLVMGIGTVAELAAAWQIVTPITPIAWQWILVVAGVVIPLVSVQDLRDIDGDRAIGRKTFPIAFGETASRLMLCVGFVILPVVLHFVLMMPQGQTWNVISCDIVLAIISLSIATRIMFYRSPQADHRTYMLYTYWYCFTLASAIIVL